MNDAHMPTVIASTRRSNSRSPMPKAPAELHWRWTLARLLAGGSSEQVRRELLEDDLPAPPVAELDARRKACRPPPGFRFHGSWHADAQVWLHLLRLDRLAEGAREATGALRILREPRLREMVETALILGVPATAIAATALATWETAMEAAAVQTFKDLFMRVEILTRAQLRVAVEDRVRVGFAKVTLPTTDPGTIARELARDPRVVAASLPATATSWSTLADSMGWAVT